MSETRTRQRIRNAVESRGYRVTALTWEPIYPGGEKAGLCGGWDLQLDRPYLPNTRPGDNLGALNVEELLAEIDYWLRPGWACACDRRHSATLAARLINDPQKPTHAVDCAWHIPYRLSWWTTP